MINLVVLCKYKHMELLIIARNVSICHQKGTVLSQ